MAELAWKVLDANRSGVTEFAATEEDLNSCTSIDFARNKRHRPSDKRAQAEHRGRLGITTCHQENTDTCDFMDVT